MLKSILNHTVPSNVQLHLFTNDHTPVEATVIGNLTEAIQAGYAAITLTGTSWTVATVGDVTTASYAIRTFTFSGVGANVYGYYITDTDGTPNLLWLERFSDAPFVIPSSGGTISITPTITME
jgi:hypothetical protein